jgi:hypothetical protein
VSAAIVITPAPSDPPLFVESLTARGTKTRAREVQRILAELSDADRASIADGATRAAAGGWPDGPVAAPPAPSPLAASERKLATVREGVTAELKSLGQGA